MIDYIKGTIVDLTPAELILENNGIGYRILISLQTYQVLENKKEATVYIYHYLREDMELYYGFATKDERELFELLISVSGIGVNSARMMLSSLSAEEIRHAILSEDIARIKSVKGIGLKSAQRMVLELKDKISLNTSAEELTAEDIGGTTDVGSDVLSEALAALTSLGYSESEIMPVVKRVGTKNTTEALIKAVLKEFAKG